MESKLSLYIAKNDINVVEAMQKIDKGTKGILFITDEQDSLIGCVTDGDIRRWLIKTADLTATANSFMHKNPKFIFKADDVDIQKYLMQNSISALPILDVDRKILNIVFRNDKISSSEAYRNSKLKDVSVVIMAGGKGTRLYPYTKILPKPLIPIGEIPIIERIVNRFVNYGAKDFFFTVNYKKGMIKSYFDDLNPEYRVTYVEENKPLGTGGSLKLINRKFDKPIFVTNCDILIEADLADVYKQHLQSGNAITVVASLKNIVIPYGVLEVEKQGLISAMKEKPSISHFINTGMYIVNPDLLDFIPNDTFYHMPQLLEDVMAKGMKVGIYPLSEDAFLDMGEFEEMKRMEEKLHV